MFGLELNSSLQAFSVFGSIVTDPIASVLAHLRSYIGLYTQVATTQPDDWRDAEVNSNYDDNNLAAFFNRSSILIFSWYDSICEHHANFDLSSLIIEFMPILKFVTMCVCLVYFNKIRYCFLFLQHGEGHVCTECNYVQENCTIQDAMKKDLETRSCKPINYNLVVNKDGRKEYVRQIISRRRRVLARVF